MAQTPEMTCTDCGLPLNDCRCLPLVYGPIHIAGYDPIRTDSRQPSECARLRESNAELLAALELVERQYIEDSDVFYAVRTAIANAEGNDND